VNLGCLVFTGASRVEAAIAGVAATARAARANMVYRIIFVLLSVGPTGLPRNVTMMRTRLVHS
jgi:hypothetical protein